MVEARDPQDPEIGIGLHCGTFLLGSLGGATRAQFGAIGDAVNLASAAVAERATGRKKAGDSLDITG